MRKTLALGAAAFSTLFFISGCKKNETRADAVEADESFDQVGEMRVFDSPRRQKKGAKLENVPAPAPIAARRAVKVGELDLEE